MFTFSMLFDIRYKKSHRRKNNYKESHQVGCKNSYCKNPIQSSMQILHENLLSRDVADERNALTFETL